jgi:hypothetical protein
MTSVRLEALTGVSYGDLYARWERSNWSATQIDFSRDREQWHNALDDTQRRAAVWNYAMFFHGEDSVATSLTPFIEAAPREEQRYFLATQQVDEARHAVFFGRFIREVVGQGDSYATALEATADQLTWGFRGVFEELERTTAALRANPSRPHLARAVMLYHLVIEAALAQPGQHFIERSLEQQDILPGLLAGIRNVSLDEQRHIGFGVKLLSELIVDPECRAAAIELIRDVGPRSIAVFVPPDWDRSYTEVFGFTLEETYAAADRSLATKMRTAGFTQDEIGALGMSADMSAEERSQDLLVLLQAGVLGEKKGPPASGEPVLRAMFNQLRVAANPEGAPSEPFTVQWDFADADPWALRVDNGSTRAEPGRAESPDMTFRCRFEDWADVFAGREGPQKLLVRRRLRVKPLRMLWRSSDLFPA